MRVEVVYARAEVQVLVDLEVAEAATVKQAIEQSGLLDRFPEIDVTRNKVGIFSQLCGLEQRLTAGDRVEIYRPLLADPQELRRSRAAQRASR